MVVKVKKICTGTKVSVEQVNIGTKGRQWINLQRPPIAGEASLLRQSG